MTLVGPSLVVVGGSGSNCEFKSKVCCQNHWNDEEQEFISERERQSRLWHREMGPLLPEEHRVFDIVEQLKAMLIRS